jgi:hypothetical protein
MSLLIELLTPCSPTLCLLTLRLLTLCLLTLRLLTLCRRAAWHRAAARQCLALAYAMFSETNAAVPPRTRGNERDS